MKRLIMVTILPTVIPFVALGADDGFTAPKVEGVNIPWKAIAIIAVIFVGIVYMTLKNSRRTQSELKVH